MIDIATIQLTAGNGGNGAVSFRREKYEPSGGPNGGDGGNGGSIYLIASSELTTLSDFKYKTKYKAQNGQNGQKSNKFGSKGEDLYLKVPVGTIIREKDSGKIIKDLKENGQEFLIAKGGKGGKGNARYKNSVRQAPRFAQVGEKGQYIEIIMELKMLADVGLIGLPNVGKSTLISVMSNANPKIGNYHFTTLDPNLGVVKVDSERSFVLADIPGIIEGASGGLGLGLDFLKHVERCRVLVHVIDISDQEQTDPVKNYEMIRKELSLYNEKLKDKVEVIALNKVDMDFDNNSQVFKENYPDKKIFEISAITHRGIKELQDYLTEILSKIEINDDILDEKVEESYLDEYYNKEIDFDLNVKKDNEIFVVYGKRIDNLVERINFQDYDSRMFFELKLKEMGVYDMLIERGIKDGDLIRIKNLEFEYYE